ncbi:hypothetical protein QCD60_00740 [Pokkaliibacter sp. MBI-7]|uniref:RHS repeat domain-containing protein n=1 Tax=Pokkaliibacter sp. MBI-7 TaxID=3040600 RepID=UPI002447FAD0|nr:hypothetical protein [Pokkaliibacter sp. MBI-7]MDH2431080.1 hypothetical protein [Pokkaliibacter sp. MBI-7]
MKGKTKVSNIHVLTSFFVMLLCSVANAFQFGGNSTPEKEMMKKYTPKFSLEPLGENPFGEKLGLKDGRVSFYQEDVVLEGNGPTIRVARSLSPEEEVVNTRSSGREIGNWDLEIPRIVSIVQDEADQVSKKKTSTPNGDWRVRGNNPYARCSNFGLLETSQHWENKRNFRAEDWWQGVDLDIPNEGRQSILQNNGSLITKNNWNISCLSSTKNGKLGEAFLVTSPDGTKYWFDWMVSRRILDLDYSYPIIDASTALIGNAFPSPVLSTTRAEVSFYPTRVEDINGNYLLYKYSGNNLVEISGSDGRLVRATWKKLKSSDIENSLDSVTVLSGAAQKKWKYSYTDRSHLESVTLPDGRKWSFYTRDLNDKELSTNSNFYFDKVGDEMFFCRGGYHPLSISFGVYNSITMEHPSGLKGNFRFETSLHNIKYSSEEFNKNACVPLVSVKASDIGIDVADYLIFDPRYLSVSLIEKSYTGKGVSQNWSYEYITGDPAPSVSIAIVTNPDTKKDVYMFDNVLGESLGDLLDIYYDVALDKTNTVTAYKRREHMEYADNRQEYPERVGVTVEVHAAHDRIEKYHPQVRKTIYQEGNVFTQWVETFDKLARPVIVTRSNDIAGNVPLRLLHHYFDNEAKNIFGLPANTTNLANGDVINNQVYNSNGQLLEQYSFGQLQGKYSWNSAGLLTSAQDALGNTTTYSQYKLGIPQKVVYADGSSESVQVNGFGEVVSHTDQLGAVRRFTYNPLGWMTSESYPSEADGQVWHSKNYVYDYPDGALRVTEHFGKATTITSYDVMQRPIATVQSGNGQSLFKNFSYDWRGNTTFESYAYDSGSIAMSTKGIRTIYDALGRVVAKEQDSELGILKSTIQYLKNMGVTVTDVSGNRQSSYYQAYDQPEYKNLIKSVMGGITQTITRDIYGRPQQLTQFGSYNGVNSSITKKYFYNSTGQLCRYQEPEGKSDVFAYDAAGRVTWRAEGINITTNDCGLANVPASEKTAISYDLIGREKLINFPDATPDITFTYDKRGSRTSAVAGAVVRTYGYNRRGLMTSEALALDGFNWKTAYGYNAYGVRDSMTYPSGTRVDTVPDVFGRATRAGSYAYAAQYGPNGIMKAFTYGNGTQFSKPLNVRGAPQGITYANTNTKYVGLTYSYDKKGNLLQQTDSIPGSKRGRTMQYDMFDRLVSSKSARDTSAEVFKYDALNNLREISSDTLTKVFNYNAVNQLVNITHNNMMKASYDYDSRGNATLKNGIVLTYDKANRLVGYMGGNSRSYDANGNLVKSVDDGDVPKYAFYSDGGQLLFEYKAGNGFRNYIYLANNLVAKQVCNTAVDCHESTPATVNKDTDADGLSDDYEAINGLNGLSKDSDGDGLPDAWEVQYGLDPLLADAGLDSDGDGLSNLQEYINGSNPIYAGQLNMAAVLVPITSLLLH